MVLLVSQGKPLLSSIKVMKLIYLNYSLSSVFESQVLELLNHVKGFPNIDDVHLFCGYLNKAEKFNIQQLCDRLSVKVTFFKAYPNYPFYNFLNRRSLGNVMIALLDNNNDVIIHTRGESAIFLLKKILGKSRISFNRVLVDVRGSGKEEILEFKKLIPLAKWLKVWNYEKALTCISSFKYINAVSPSLRDYIIRKTDIIPGDNITVIPSFAGQRFSFNTDKRIILRNELGVSPKDILMIVSSGGTGQWQNNEAIIELANTGYKALNLSRINIAHPNVINKFVSYDQVPFYLQAADIALIMRSKSIVNEVSSPVKFSEFICSGLPIITNRNIAVINDYIEETGFGAITDSLIDITPEIIHKLLTISRKKIASFAMHKFGINAVAARYNELYCNMIKEK